MDNYWFYFEVDNQMNEPLWLDVGSIFSWELEVYIQVDDSTFALHDKRAASNQDGIRTCGHHKHWISLPKTYTYGKRACFVRIQSAGPVEFPLTIGSLADLYRLKRIMIGS